MGILNNLLIAGTPVIGVLSSALSLKEGFNNPDKKRKQNLSPEAQLEAQLLKQKPKMTTKLILIFIVTLILVFLLIRYTVLLHKAKNGHWFGYIIAVFSPFFYLMVHFVSYSMPKV